MNSQNDTPAAIPPRRMHPVLTLIPVVALAAIIVAGIITYILPPSWHPTLEVKNTGTNAVTLSFKGETFVCQPGQTWHNRFYGGDTLTLRAATVCISQRTRVGLIDRADPRHADRRISETLFISRGRDVESRQRRIKVVSAEYLTELQGTLGADKL